MSSKVAIVVCGNSGIDYINHNDNIEIFRSSIYIDDKVYEDYVDIACDDFFKILKKPSNYSLKVRSTSSNMFLEIYKHLEEEGYTDILVITMSSALNGSFNKAILASRFQKNLKVYVYDSKSVLYPHAKMAIIANELANKGASIKEIIYHLDKIKNNSYIYFYTSNLKQVKKSGKVRVKSNLLGKIKNQMLMKITDEGKIELINKMRSSKRVLNKLKENFFSEINLQEVEPFIMYSDNYDLAKSFANEIKSKYQNIKKVLIYPITPALGSIFGTGSIALGYIKSEGVKVS